MPVQPFNIAIFEGSTGRRQLLTVPNVENRRLLVNYLTNILGATVFSDWYRLANSSAVTSAISRTYNLGGVAFNLPEALE